MELPRQIERYRILEQVGSGEFAVVLKAESEGKYYAIKLSKRISVGEKLASFQNEISVISKMQIPSVPRIYGHGFFEGHGYIVMDLIDGVTLRSLIQSNHILQYYEVVKIAVGVAQCLAALHNKGVLHKDLKPENVIVGTNGAPHVIDFGLSDELDSIEQLEQRPVGTLLYAAPEQIGIGDGGPDARSDLYSLGAVLFEAMSGRPPHEAGNVSDLISNHLRGNVPLPGSHRTPSDLLLARIVAKLLGREPENRYQTASGLLFDLMSLEKPESLRQAGSFLLGSVDSAMVRLSGLKILPVGRDAEMVKLNGILEQNSISPRKVLILGEPGLGKTTFVRKFLEINSKRYAVVCPYKCSPSDEGTPFSGLNGLLRKVFAATLGRRDETEFKETRSFLEANYSSMLTICPDIQSWLQKSQGAEFNQKFDITRASNLIGDFFQVIGGEAGRMCLWVDDLQWSDSSTRVALSRVLNSFRNEKIDFIFTSRIQSDTDQLLVEEFGEFNFSDQEILKLIPLSGDGVDLFLNAVFGQEGFNPYLTDSLTEISRGNPLFLSEIISSCLQSGEIIFDQGLWRSKSPKLELSGISTDVISIYEMRIRSITPELRDLLIYASILGDRFSRSKMADLLGLAAVVVDAYCAELIVMEIFEALDSESLAFCHDRIREAVDRVANMEEKKRALNRIVNLTNPNEALLNSAEVIKVAEIFSAVENQPDELKAFLVFESAGKKMLEGFTYKQSTIFFGKALEYIGVVKESERIIRFWKSFAYASLAAGDSEKALECIKNGLFHKPRAEDVAEFYIYESMAYSTAGELRKSFAAFKKAVTALGSPYPESRLWFFLKYVFMFVTSNILARTGLFKGWASNRLSRDRRNRHFILNLAYENIRFVCYPMGLPLDLSYIVLCQYYHAHLLGNSGELAMAHVGMYFLWAILGNRKNFEFHYNKALEIGDAFGDKTVKTATRGVASTALQYLGDHAQAISVGKKGMEDAERYHTLMIQTIRGTDLVYQYAIVGRIGEAIELARRLVRVVDGSNNIAYRLMLRGIYYFSLSIAGQESEAERVFGEWRVLFESTDPDLKLCTQNLPAYMIAVLVELDGASEDIEKYISDFKAVGFNEFYTSFVYVYIAKFRLNNLSTLIRDPKHWLPSGEVDWDHVTIQAAYKRLESEVIEARKVCKVGVLRGQLFAVEAGYERLRKNWEDHIEMLASAEKLGDLTGSYWIHYDTLVERALGRLGRGDNEQAHHFFGLALHLAREMGWTSRCRALTDLARDLGFEWIHSNQKQLVVADEIKEVVAKRDQELDGALAALLRVSAVSSQSLDPEQQIKDTLLELIEVFNADRAFIFLVEEKCNDERLAFVSGIDSSGQVLRDPTKFSQTVIQNVFRNGEPTILAGNDEMEAIGAHSAILHGLRSIMAAPIWHKGIRRGVVYIDSRVSKGLFKKSDIEVFKAIAGHIGLAFERLKAFKGELQRQLLVKDLALGSAVQQMFLPRPEVVSANAFNLFGLVKSAALCGGDFWWFDSRPEGRLRVILGDVTGHGVGPALITAGVSSLLHHMAKYRPLMGEDIGQSLMEIHRSVIDIADQEFLVAGNALDIDFDRRRVGLYGFGGTGLLRVSGGGEVRHFMATGSMIGMDPFSVEHKIIPIECGDRLILFSDGLIEAQVGQSQLGMRRFVAKIRSLSGHNCEVLTREMLKWLQEEVGDQEQEDDMTFITIELR